MAAAVQAKTFYDMIMSMELQRPRLTPVLLQWDLGIFLEALSKPPYEPLREASLKHLTLKTVFLLAMASAGRPSALVFDAQYTVYTVLMIQFKPKGAGVTLYFTPEFSQKKSGLTRSMTLGTFQRFQLVNQILVLQIAT